MRTPTFLVALLIAASLPASAQTLLKVGITASAAPVNVLTLQDVDFVNSTSPKWLFTIGLSVQGAAGYNMSVTATMRLFLDAALSTGESFPSASRYETVPFTIQGSRSFTNLDLRNPELRRDYSLDATAKKRFEETALSSGIVPAGVYTFRIEVVDARTQLLLGSGSFKFVLSNPSRLKLLFPLDNDIAVGQFPLFQWDYDGPRSRISIFERLPNQSTPEETASGIPQVQTEVAGISFLYPSAGVRPLEPGKTYVWYVEGLFGTAGASSSALRSPIRTFTVSTQGGNAAIQTLLDELEKSLGPRYKPLFDRIRDEALTPTGQIFVNGTPVTVNDLVKLIAQFRENPGNVLNADIE